MIPFATGGAKICKTKWGFMLWLLLFGNQYSHCKIVGFLKSENHCLKQSHPSGMLVDLDMNVEWQDGTNMTVSCNGTFQSEIFFNSEGKLIFSRLSPTFSWLWKSVTSCIFQKPHGHVWLNTETGC